MLLSLLLLSGVVCLDQDWVYFCPSGLPVTWMYNLIFTCRSDIATSLTLGTAISLTWAYLHSHVPSVHGQLCHSHGMVISHCSSFSGMSKVFFFFPKCCCLATSSSSHTQFDFWTQAQDLPFIPIMFSLVRLALLFQPVEIILEFGCVGCIPSVNLISMLSMFSSQSSIERMGSTEARTRPSRSLEIALKAACDQSISIHWVLSLIQVAEHRDISSPSHTLHQVHGNIREYFVKYLADS